MALRFEVTVDCADPHRLARFWKALLGYVDHPAPAGFATWVDYDRAQGREPGQPRGDWTDDDWAIVDPAGVGPRIYFQQVPEPKLAKNRVHLDVRAAALTSDRDAEAAYDEELTRAVGLGATVLDRAGHVLADPEGNEFCLIG